MNSSASLKWDSTGARPNMTSVFDFDDAINTAYNAKTAGKNLVTAKHEVLTKAGDFLFLAHSDKEFALRCQMMEADIESAAKRKMASVSDSKFKLVRALHEEWKIRHASCSMCKTATPLDYKEPRATSEFDANGTLKITREPGRSTSTGTCDDCHFVVACLVGYVESGFDALLPIPSVCH